MQSNNRLGIMLMLLTTLVFAAQDGISKHLAQEYNVLVVVMIRYWFFAAFAFAVARRKAGGPAGFSPCDCKRKSGKKPIADHHHHQHIIFLCQMF